MRGLNLERDVRRGCSISTYECSSQVSTNLVHTMHVSVMLLVTQLAWSETIIYRAALTGVNFPVRRRRSVLFPTPFGPTIQTGRGGKKKKYSFNVIYSSDNRSDIHDSNAFLCDLLRDSISIPKSTFLNRGFCPSQPKSTPQKNGIQSELSFSHQEPLMTDNIQDHSTWTKYL